METAVLSFCPSIIYSLLCLYDKYRLQADVYTSVQKGNISLNIGERYNYICSYLNKNIQDGVKVITKVEVVRKSNFLC